MKNRTNQKRDQNLYDFKTYVLEGLQMIYPIKEKKQGFYRIKTKQYGDLDIYPKANKVMFHNSGKWINDGMNWLCNNL